MPTDIPALVSAQRAYFASGATRDWDFRVNQLKKLKRLIHAHEADVLRALAADLRKPELEAYASEIGVLMIELNMAIANTARWARPRRVAPLLAQIPSVAEIHSEPYGTALIIAPWNYPFVLILAPLVAAIAAGNCAILKPAELAPNTADLVARLVGEVFDPAYIAVVQGDAEVAQALLSEHFDYIFYTGNASVGRLIMESAAKTLTPVTLEMGGKSPSIVDAEADLELAARRISAGKFWNAGQTCIAPDYVLVPERLKEEFVARITTAVRESYGRNPQASPDFARIVHVRHFQRLRSLLGDGNIVHGGACDESDLYVGPTVLDKPGLTSRLMQDEIFGPLLPVVTYGELDEAIQFVNLRPKPLALYFFSQRKSSQDHVLRSTSFGGGCINDTLTHFAPATLPFGGVGSSGIGRYRGHAGFEAFSNTKSVIRRSPLAMDWLVRFAPYRVWQLRLARLFLR